MNDLSIRIIQTDGDRRVEQLIELKGAQPVEYTTAAPTGPRVIDLPVDQRFIPGDGVVHDNLTGLCWAAATSPKRMNWKAAKDYAFELRLQGHEDWRLPTIRELLTLVDYDKHSPAIDKAAFPDTQSAGYWSSSPDASAPAGCAWIVGFSYGLAGIGDPGAVYFVRPVRSVAAPASQ